MKITRTFNFCIFLEFVQNEIISVLYVLCCTTNSGIQFHCTQAITR